MPEPVNPKQHILYRHFGHDGELLYVGITADPGRRFQSHAAATPWWNQVIGITLEHFANRVELRQAEKAAIQSENPRYNKTHSAGFRRTPRGRSLERKAAEQELLPPSDPESNRAVINGKRYILPPGLYWDPDQLAVRQR